MNSKTHFVLILLLAICLSPGRDLRGQEDKEAPDPDLKEMMEMANQMQKEADKMPKANPPDDQGKPKKSMAELQAIAKQQMAEIEQKEKAQKEKLDAALKKQLEAPGPVAFPDWTPKMPEMKPDGPISRKIIDEQVNVVLTGTSALTPAELGDAWEKAKSDKVNFGRSNNRINDLKQVIIYLHPQSSDEEVRMDAQRRDGEKVTRITISSPLPKPDVEDD